MAYIGRTPTGSILTGADIADGSISTAKLADTAVSTAKIADNAIVSSKITDGTIATGDIADDAIGNTKLNLASDYAFTGTISGAGDVSNLVQVSSVSLGTSSAYAHNGIFSSSYDTYLITMDMIGVATDNTSVKFKFYNNTGATSDNTYRGFTMSESGAGNQNQSFHNAYPFLSVNQSNSGNAGMSGYMWVFNPITTSTETAFTFSTAHERHDGYSGVNMGSGVTTDHASKTHTGFYWFTTQGNFSERAKVVVYGVKRT